MGKLLHGANYFGHPLYAIERLLDGPWDLGQQIVKILLLHACAEPSQALLRDAPGRRFDMNLAGHGDNFVNGGPRVLHKPGVVSDILGGGIDFVADSRRQLSDGLQFLRLPQLLLKPPPFRDVVYLGEKSRWLAVRIAHQRQGNVAPDGMTVLVETSLFRLIGFQTAAGKLLETELSLGIILKTGNLAKGLGQKILFRIAQEI